jgi:hypothetical protein
VRRIAEESRTELSISLGINLLLCPRLDGNPWTPTFAGCNGYVFVGLPGSHPINHAPLRCILWVGHAPRIANTPWQYECAGEYEAVRTFELSVNEWYALSEEV